MIKKFSSIRGMAVFKEFVWDQEVRDSNRAIVEFKDINILYGRNYSGKTTLSRIARAMETGSISQKYEDPELQVLFSDGSFSTQTNLTGHQKKIRVFNEDFVRENLKFITNPDDSIEPFAILGEDNNKIEQEIAALEEELGSSEENQETGLYAQLVEARKVYSKAKFDHKNAKEALEKKIAYKATDRTIGIKYNSDKFGDQNYNAAKLNGEIKKVLNADYLSIDHEQIGIYEQLITEKLLPSSRALNPPELKFDDFNKSVKSLVTQKISDSNKIEELVRDALLNHWVHEGKKLHEHKLDNCAFCGNSISDKRWTMLEKHFDAESEELNKKIALLIEDISSHSNKVGSALQFDKSIFYSKFHDRLDLLESSYKDVLAEYIETLNRLTIQLYARSSDIFNSQEFDAPIDVSNKLTAIWDDYKSIQKDSDEYKQILGKDQLSAKLALRLHEVSTFVITISYVDAISDIEAKETALGETEKSGKLISNEISEKKKLIESKKRELNDEEKGAKKVNEYLNDFFGHQYLSLESRSVETTDSSTTNVRFEVIRDGKKAYHLSEGERSLLAFCYFMAKLDDTYTKNSKPIIWIDDPISSLDSNHVFFIYSLVNAEIVSGGKFEQLFISTHNLDFLKYLKRLTGRFVNAAGNSQEYNKAYFLVSRKDTISSIGIMPKYLKDYVTEFNYLFHQIFKCAHIQNVDDSNYTTFYNFGNNARKFLEIYLFYKYPDQGSNDSTLKLFFGAEIPSVLTDRINNEYSHLAGVFEEGQLL